MRLAALPVIDKTPVRPVPAVYRRSRPAAGVSDQAGALDGAKAGTASGRREARQVAQAPAAMGLVGRPLDAATAFGLHQIAEDGGGDAGGFAVTSSMRAAGAYRQAQRGFPIASFPYDRAAGILSTVS